VIADVVARVAGSFMIRHHPNQPNRVGVPITIESPGSSLLVKVMHCRCFLLRPGVVRHRFPRLRVNSESYFAAVIGSMSMVAGSTIEFGGAIASRIVSRYRGLSLPNSPVSYQETDPIARDMSVAFVRVVNRSTN